MWQYTNKKEKILLAQRIHDLSNNESRRAQVWLGETLPVTSSDFN
jgi:hypothetical protein